MRKRSQMSHHTQVCHSMASESSPLRVESMSCTNCSMDTAVVTLVWVESHWNRACRSSTTLLNLPQSLRCHPRQAASRPGNHPACLTLTLQLTFTILVLQILEQNIPQVELANFLVQVPRDIMQSHRLCISGSASGWIFGSTWFPTERQHQAGNDVASWHCLWRWQMSCKWQTRLETRDNG